MNFPKILIELYCEEIPASQANDLIEQWKKQWHLTLSDLGMHIGQIVGFVTPHRLAIIFDQLELIPQSQIKVGPSRGIAFLRDGKSWSDAAKAWAQRENVALDKAEWMQKGKSEVLIARMPFETEAFKNSLPQLVAQTLTAISLKKSMTWNADQPMGRFIRPIRSGLIFYGDESLKGMVFDVELKNFTFIDPPFCEQSLTIVSSETYLDQLRAVGIELDALQRRNAILKQMEYFEQKYALSIQRSEAVLNESIYLTERPWGLLGRIDSRYLKLPEALVTHTLNHHQKAFSVKTREHQQLAPYFFVVSQKMSRDDRAIQEGYEFVIRSRLEDVLFFYNNDLKTPFHQWACRLNDLTINKKLGTFYHKIKRLQSLFTYLFGSLSAELPQAMRAIELSKCDLVSQVVIEIPELAGMMGAHYAQLNQEPAEICQAIAEHYLPKQGDDPLPSTVLAARIALVDKVDLVVGCIGIGFVATANADPYAVRRNAFGVLRLLIADKVDASDLDLGELIQVSVACYEENQLSEGVIEECLQFFRQRLKFILQKQQVDLKLIQAFLSQGELRMAHLCKQVQTFSAALTHSTGQMICQAEKRVRQLLNSQGLEGKRLFDSAYPLSILSQVKNFPEMKGDRWAQMLTQSLLEAEADNLLLSQYEHYWEKLGGMAKNLIDFLESVHLVSEEPNRKNVYFKLLASALIRFNNLLNFSLL